MAAVAGVDGPGFRSYLHHCHLKVGVPPSYYGMTQVTKASAWGQRGGEKKDEMRRKGSKWYMKCLIEISGIQKQEQLSRDAGGQCYHLQGKTSPCW